MTKAAAVCLFFPFRRKNAEKRREKQPPSGWVPPPCGTQGLRRLDRWFLHILAVLIVAKKKSFELVKCKIKNGFGGGYIIVPGHCYFLTLY